MPAGSLPQSWQGQTQRTGMNHTHVAGLLSFHCSTVQRLRPITSALAAGPLAGACVQERRKERNGNAQKVWLFWKTSVLRLLRYELPHFRAIPAVHAPMLWVATGVKLKRGHDLVDAIYMWARCSAVQDARLTLYTTTTPTFTFNALPLLTSATDERGTAMPSFPRHQE